MTASGVRHTRKGRVHNAPVLLDQRSMVRIGLVMALFLVVIFMSGYVVGFQKAELRLSAPTARHALTLPEPVAVLAETVEPEIPLQIEPGENIDVDSADPAEQVAYDPGPAVSQNKKADIAGADQTVLHDAAQDTDTLPMGMGGPAASDPGHAAETGSAALYDNATRELARYTIQTGMYSQLGNAERKVKELTSAELSAYFDEYLNARNETRYNVRFGYYQDHGSARRALKAYQQEMAGSGYIVNLQPATTDQD